jgi:hypothetical protein
MDSPRNGADENLKDIIAAKREPRFADHENARRARLQHAKPGTGANAEFGHPTHPSGLAVNLGDVGLLAALQKFERNCIHKFGAEMGKKAGSRLNLNIPVHSALVKHAGQRLYKDMPHGVDPR